VIKQLRPSMGLGVGFGVNNVFRSLFADVWLKLLFQLAYVSSMTVAIPVAQIPARRELDYHREHFSSYCVKVLELLILSGSFVVAWAWKVVFDFSSHPVGTSAAGQLGASMCVSVVLITLVALAVALGPKVPEVWLDTLTTVVGLNFGWTWMDYSADVASKFATSTLGLWACTVVIITILLAVVMLAELVAHKCEERMISNSQEGTELSVAPVDDGAPDGDADLTQGP